MTDADLALRPVARPRAATDRFRQCSAAAHGSALRPTPSRSRLSPPRIGGDSLPRDSSGSIADLCDRACVMRRHQALFTEHASMHHGRASTLLDGVNAPSQHAPMLFRSSPTPRGRAWSVPGQTTVLRQQAPLHPDTHPQPSSTRHDRPIVTSPSPASCSAEAWRSATGTTPAHLG